MVKDPLHKQFLEARRTTIENIQAILLILDECIDQGLLDPESRFHNELIGFDSQATQAKEYAQLGEVITQAKILETDIDVWLAGLGRSTLSLSWPMLPERS